jgi:hypothetical protein
MFRTFFVACLAAASVLASNLANAEGISPKQRPLKSVAEATARTTQPLIATASESSSAKRERIVA